jgi:hypothetical protein
VNRGHLLKLPGSAGGLFEVDNCAFRMESASLKYNFLQHYLNTEV